MFPPKPAGPPQPGAPKKKFGLADKFSEMVKSKQKPALGAAAPVAPGGPGSAAY